MADADRVSAELTATQARVTIGALGLILGDPEFFRDTFPGGDWAALQRARAAITRALTGGTDDV